MTVLYDKPKLSLYASQGLGMLLWSVFLQKSVGETHLSKVLGILLRVTVYSSVLISKIYKKQEVA